LLALLRFADAPPLRAVALRDAEAFEPPPRFAAEDFVAFDDFEALADDFFEDDDLLLPPPPFDDFFDDFDDFAEALLPPPFDDFFEPPPPPFLPPFFDAI